MGTLRITSGGSRKWDFNGRFDGKRIRVPIGDYTDVSVEEAREKAIEYRRMIRDGTNPRLEIDRIKAERMDANDTTFRRIDAHSQTTLSMREKGQQRWQSHASRTSANGTNRKCHRRLATSAFGGLTDMPERRAYVLANIAAGKPQVSFSGYSPRSMARSSRKRIFPVLPPSEITKRTCPCLEVLA